jgi:hypothetical protein
MVDRSGVSGGTRRARLVVPGIVVLLVVVAVAAAGSAPGTSSGTRRPSQWFLDVFASLVLVLMALGTVLLVVLVILRPQELVDQVATRGRTRGRATATISLVVIALLLAFAIRRFVSADGASAPGIDAGSVSDAAASIGGDRYEPAFATSAMVVVLVGLAVTVTAAFLVARRRTPDPDAMESALQGELADVLDDAIAELRAELDPRRAVIGAYARLERVFAVHGVPRHPAEAPEEYLARVLETLDVPQQAVSRLTALFATAKFSQHDVRPEMKDEAIDALVTARDALRLAAEHARSHRTPATGASREPTAV